MNLRWVMETLVVLLALQTIACGAAAGENPLKGGPVETGRGSLTAARKYLEGRWLLESFEVLPPGKAPVTLRGQGTLVYDDFGNLNVEIRTDEQSADLLRAAGIEMRDNVVSTSGRTVVDLQNKTLTYVLEGQAAPMTRSGGPLALNRPRHWEVEADVLTVTTKDDRGNPLSVGRWRRVP
jgi:hypothetical protein